MLRIPIVIVQWFEGRTVKQKEKVAEAITEALVKIAGTSKDKVTIIFYDLKRENVAKGGILVSTS